MLIFTTNKIELKLLDCTYMCMYNQFIVSYKNRLRQYKIYNFATFAFVFIFFRCNFFFI